MGKPLTAKEASELYRIPSLEEWKVTQRKLAIAVEALEGIAEFLNEHKFSGGRTDVVHEALKEIKGK